MKQVGIFILSFIIAISFLQYINNKTDFSTKSYIENFNNVMEMKPELPTLTYDNGYNRLTNDYNGTALNFFDSCAEFFVFIGECLWYPFDWLIFVNAVVFSAFFGLLAW